MRRPRGCCAACWTSRPVRSAFNLDARGLGVCHWPARPGQSPIRTGYARRRHWRMTGIPLARCIERMRQRHDFFGCRRAAELDAGAPQQGLGIALGAPGLEQQMDASRQRPPQLGEPLAQQRIALLGALVDEAAQQLDRAAVCRGAQPLRRLVQLVARRRRVARGDLLACVGSGPSPIPDLPRTAFGDVSRSESTPTGVMMFS